tara:strand:- start:376 stop:633 length:258 start_codon:yes stop_codon:yes gene_type:complete
MRLRDPKTRERILEKHARGRSRRDLPCKKRAKGGTSRRPGKGPPSCHVKYQERVKNVNQARTISEASAHCSTEKRWEIVLPSSSS